MEEFGVINVRELERLRKSFLLLSQAIDFPDDEVRSQEFAMEVLKNFPQIPEKNQFLSVLKEFQAKSLQELQENYTGLFELNKRITMYCTYYRFEDSRERGGILAKLKMLYEMFGVELDMAEMTDYLPTMLEFLGLGVWTDGPVEDTRIEDLNLLFSVLEDGTYEILKQAEELVDEPYLDLVRLIRSSLRYCIIDGGDNAEMRKGEKA
ncbi:MAG: nitrate reductase molybdenum cofactor assembly chaperone [Streptococcaceae bacterium]|nr:nitrate reductase molybdenum cofactor assembly chaperone [Streptococcaceae bacterium]